MDFSPSMSKFINPNRSDVQSQFFLVRPMEKEKKKKKVRACFPVLNRRLFIMRACGELADCGESSDEADDEPHWVRLTLSPFLSESGES